MAARREKILSELLTTESRYSADLEEVLVHYRDKLVVSNLTETRIKAQVCNTKIFVRTSCEKTEKRDLQLFSPHIASR